MNKIQSCKYGQSSGDTIKCVNACDCGSDTFLESGIFYAILIGTLLIVVGAIYIAHMLGY
jgi:hypothetical protein